MLCKIPASQANLGKLVKVFEDHLYFLMKDKGQISVLTYNHDLFGENVMTKKEVVVKLPKEIKKTY